MNLIKVIFEPGGVGCHRNGLEPRLCVLEMGRASSRVRDSVDNNLQESVQSLEDSPEEAKLTSLYRRKVNKIPSGSEAFWVLGGLPCLAKELLYCHGV